MPTVTFFAFKPYLVARKPGRVVPGEAVEVPSISAAMRRLRDIKAGLISGAVGGIAYSRTGDPDLGDWRDAVILGYEGEVPPSELDPAVDQWD